MVFEVLLNLKEVLHNFLRPLFVGGPRQPRRKRLKYQE